MRQMRQNALAELTRTLYAQMEEGGWLGAVIRENLAGLEYGE